MHKNCQINASRLERFFIEADQYYRPELAFRQEASLQTQPGGKV